MNIRKIDVLDEGFDDKQQTWGCCIMAINYVF